MKTELESLKLALLLAERAASHPDLYTPKAVLAEVQGVRAAFERLENCYNSLQSQEPPDWKNTNWHLTTRDDVPFDKVMAHIFVKALRQLPWPPGIMVRWCPSDARAGQGHEFVVHHFTQTVSVGMEVING